MIVDGVNKVQRQFSTEENIGIGGRILRGIRRFVENVENTVSAFVFRKEEENNSRNGLRGGKPAQSENPVRRSFFASILPWRNLPKFMTSSMDYAKRKTYYWREENYSANRRNGGRVTAFNFFFFLNLPISQYIYFVFIIL